MGANGEQPLAGLVVIDVSQFLSGPYAALRLLDLGARVIKVERPDGGDLCRRLYLTDTEIGGDSTLFHAINRGKESIALDLKATADREIFERLLAQADVLVENFRPGAMERLGYGWEALHARHPRLIYAAASGFGHSGPYAPKPAYDMVVQGMGGMMSVTGYPGQPPARVGMSIGDIGAGLYTAIAVNAALVHRLQTGQSTKVDIGMFDCQLALLENAVMRYTVEGEIPGPLGARHPTITPFQAFRTGDGNIIIAAGNDGLFVKLAEAIGRPAMAQNPDYKTNALRLKHQPRLQDEIEAVLVTKTTAEWIALIGKAGVPCGPINNIEQALQHPQVAARNMLISVPDPSGATLKLVGNPLKLSAFADPPARDPAPDLDRDREAILRELGLS
jgi:CoA:oxalate CoA-transferase